MSIEEKALMDIEDIAVINIENNDDILKFELTNVNVSIANSLRRIILSEIPCVVFKTAPYEESKAHIEINTTRMNNELIKQRLSCIPIHIKNPNIDINDLILEVDETNDTDAIKIITTEDFKIKSKSSGKYINKEETNKIFPPNKITNNYIDFVRLMPKTTISNGEQLKLTCEFIISNAKDDSMFNVVSNCCYGFTKDERKVKDERAKLEEQLNDKYLDNKSKINQELKDFDLLKSQRYFKMDDEGLPNSFDFVIETIGIYTNYELIDNACKVLIEKLNNVNNKITSNISLITQSNVTIPYCYDILLENEDYTIGKIIEYVFYEYYYKNNICSFVGFIKQHPHIDESIIRVAFYKNVDITAILDYFNESVNKLIKIYNKINKEFSGSNKNYLSIKKLEKSLTSKTEEEETKDVESELEEEEQESEVEEPEDEESEVEEPEEEEEETQKKGSYFLSEGTTTRP